VTYFAGVHLTADTLDELHAEAARIGLQRRWFQSGRHPHYDVFGAPAMLLTVNATARGTVRACRARRQE